MVVLCVYGGYISSFRTKLKLLLMSVGLDDLLVGSDSLCDLGVLDKGSLGLGNLNLRLVKSFSLHLPLGLKGGNNVLVLPAVSLRTFRAEGMTIFFFLSYGGGTPSNVCRRLRASLPLSVLCGVMPRTVLQKIFEGALKWKAPRLGLTLHLFLRKSRYFSLLR